MSKRRIILVSGSLLLLFYAVAYLFVRSQHYLVHFASSNDGHDVRIGDIGFRIIEMNPQYLIAVVCFYLFAPLRWLEILWWSVWV